MQMKMMKGSQVLAVAAVTFLACAPVLNGYVLSGRKWMTSEVVYYINPSSIHVSDAAAASAIRQAADAWSLQSDANVTLVFGGYTNGSSAAYDGKNQVFFRNETGGGYTYAWWNGSNQLLDADIILYEASRPLFTGTSGCAGGVYIEDLVTHEFGHVLGLHHSADVAATLYPTTNHCDTNWRSLAPDDIAGIEAVYPPTKTTQTPAAPSQLAAAVDASSPTSSLVLSWNDNASNENGFRIDRSSDGASFAQVGQVGSNVRSFVSGGLAAGATYYYRVYAYNSSGPSGYSNVAAGQTQSAAANTAPSVNISSPVNGGAYASSITFTGSSSDSQDGNLSAALTWSSNVDGTLGTGSGFSRTLSGGSHVITARATDSGGMTGSRQVTVTVGGSGLSLSATGHKVKKSRTAELTWSGSAASSVDVYRNGKRVTTTANDGFHTDSPSRGNSFTYQLCEKGSSVCSNAATVSF